MAGRGTEPDAHHIKIRIQTHAMAPFSRAARRTTHDSLSLSPPLSPLTEHNQTSKVLVSRDSPSVPATQARRCISNCARASAGCMASGMLRCWDRTEVRTELRLASVTDRALGQYSSLVCAPTRARLFANSLSLTRVCSSWGSGSSVPVPEPVPQGWFPGFLHRAMQASGFTLYAVYPHMIA